MSDSDKEKCPFSLNIATNHSSRRYSLSTCYLPGLGHQTKCYGDTNHYGTLLMASTDLHLIWGWLIERNWREGKEEGKEGGGEGRKEGGEIIKRHVIGASLVVS
jgi:hypothetical protein